MRSNLIHLLDLEREARRFSSAEEFSKWVEDQYGPYPPMTEFVWRHAVTVAWGAAGRTVLRTTPNHD